MYGNWRYNYAINNWEETKPTQETKMDTATETEHQELRNSIVKTHYSVAEHEAVIAQFSAQRDEAAAAATELHDKLEIKNTQLVDALRNWRILSTEFKTYKTQVRDAIIEVHEAGDLDEQDAAELLDTLGLEGMMRTYTVTVTLSQQQEVEIQATSEDDAYEKIQEKGAYNLFNDEFGGCPDYFDVEVNNVSVV